MFDTATSPRQAFRPELAFALAQKSAACWSRACTHMLEGFMFAATAQADLTRAMLTSEHAQWPASGNPSEAARRWLSGNQKQLETVKLKYRQMDDGLAAGIFAAADCLAELLSFAETAPPEGPKTATPQEKRPVAVPKEKMAAE